jgi:predicted AlkP superfamily pyrophosphatase or phosphodiesterase
MIFLAAASLLILSVDGLDNRYIRDADQLGMKIPNIRRLVREGTWASGGMVGVVPTVTWPSHTTMLTGVSPARHGILSNRRPKAEGGDYYWTFDLIKVNTLWQAACAAGISTAAITWPVTVDAPVTWNLPEYFQGRRGGAMDLRSIGSKSTGGLTASIAAEFPSFAQQWMDDRTRTLALVHLLRHRKPGLTAVHLVDLDAEQHETGPFSQPSKAILEFTDELIGQVLKELPAGTVVALVSDHGFARVDRLVHAGRVQGGLAVADAQPEGAGRRVPAEEIRRFLPDAAFTTAWEPAEGVLFTEGAGGGTIREAGVHGLWPGRPDYRATFVLWGPGVKREKLGEISMLDLAERFAGILKLKFKPGEPPAKCSPR